MPCLEVLRRKPGDAQLALTRTDIGHDLVEVDHSRFVSLFLKGLEEFSLRAC